MLPHRHTVRLPFFDYRAPGAYFVTACTRDRQPLFGHVMDGERHLSALGRIVEEEWHLLPERRAQVEIDAFVVMPDHIHGIVWITVGDVRDTDRRGAINCAPTAPGVVMPGSLSSIVRAFKAGVTRRAGAPVWQRGFYEHVIRNGRDLDNTRRYIEENPLRWTLRYGA